MSEFSKKQEIRVDKIVNLCKVLITGAITPEYYKKNQEFIKSVIPSDIIIAVDNMVLQGIPIADLKKGINKLLNLLYKPIVNYKSIKPAKNGFLYYLIEDNKRASELLDSIRPKLNELNKNSNNNDLKNELINLFEKLKNIEKHYIILENILFPIIENHVQDYRCLSVMWSYHDDIRRDLKELINELKNSKIDLKLINYYSSRIFYNVFAMIFREEKILFPYILEKIENDKLNKLLLEANEIGFGFINIDKNEVNEEKSVLQDSIKEILKLSTGELSINQIEMIFNSLPVDITFVDENNKVKYFSSPKERIFPRSKSIIGRDVKNCHPPDSVSTVMKIIESFKSGEKDKAEFWINLGNKLVYIQYFAVRDEKDNYRGVLEVTMDIKDIKNINGEKRLLDWDSE